MVSASGVVWGCVNQSNHDGKGLLTYKTQHKNYQASLFHVRAAYGDVFAHTDMSAYMNLCCLYTSGIIFLFYEPGSPRLIQAKSAIGHLAQIPFLISGQVLNSIFFLTWDG